MNTLKTCAILTASVAALATWANTAPAKNGAVTNESAVRAVSRAWYKAYNAGDGASIAALYANDAVTGPPGVPAVRGKSAILEYFVKDAAAFAAAELVDSDGSPSDVEISGNLAWQWGTYKVTDKSGAVAAAGKYIEVFQRRAGKWMIIRDIYNSDTPPDAPMWISH